MAAHDFHLSSAISLSEPTSIKNSGIWYTCWINGQISWLRTERCRGTTTFTFPSRTILIFIHISPNETYPLGWTFFFDRLLQKAANSAEISPPKAKLTFTTFKDAKELAKEFGMVEKQLKDALQVFHNLGFVLYFADNSHLNDTIFLKPQELLHALRTIITVKQFKILARNLKFGPQKNKDSQVEKLYALKEEELRDLRTNGSLKGDALRKLWANYPEALHKHLSAILCEFGLALASSPTDLIIPSLVDDPQKIEEQLDEKDFSNSAICTFDLGTIPLMGFAGRLTVRILKLTNWVSCTMI